MTTITDRIEHRPSATYTHPSSPLSLWATVGRVLGNFAAMLLDSQERARQQARLLSQQSHLVCAIAQARAEKASLIVGRRDAERQPVRLADLRRGRRRISHAHADTTVSGRPWTVHRTRLKAGNGYVAKFFRR